MTTASDRSTRRRFRLHPIMLAGGALAVALPCGAVATSDDAPAEIVLTGIARDFRERSHAGGHPDFERRPDGGFGLYCGNVAPELGPDGKPVFTGSGAKVTSQWKDLEGRPICWYVAQEYPALGDASGSMSVNDSGGITSETSFDQWYRDVPGVNLSIPVELTLVRQPDGSYVFDDREDERYRSLGGFFPLEEALFGNPGGSPDRNFHFTFELHTRFTYDEDGAQVFRFTGDDDVWVFIDGSLVIDIGGVHGRTEQVVDLDRLGLEDGRAYELAFFFAERHRTQSNFRIQTNLELVSDSLPPITAAFD